mmetsp:Transcript_9958/g.14775  ORF Transcript_9958/g.14775 Transcript_9958/m.14775 type:complete len:123 (+) Transcript_9958:53-421(+)
MNNSALLTLLAVLMAAATNIAAADDSSTPLLEPLYPENYQGEEEERDLRFSPAARARSISLETAGGLVPAQTPPDDRAQKLRGMNPMEARRGDDLKAVNEEARRATLDGGSGRNTFGIPLPP